MSALLVGYALLLATMVMLALFVTLGKNLVHSVLGLALLLCATAILFVVLRAPFLAGIQVMLYAGGVVTLMLFAIMLTRRGAGVEIVNQHIPGRRLPAALMCVGLFGLLARAIHQTSNWPAMRSGPLPTTRDLGLSLFIDHALAFEVLGILLLAATIGAIVVARKRDHGEPEAQRRYGRTTLPREGKS